jgi:hypothetical protein
MSDDCDEPNPEIKMPASSPTLFFAGAVVVIASLTTATHSHSPSGAPRSITAATFA